MTTEACFRIIYVSRNLLPSATVEADIAAILDASRRNNGRSGVTGALLFSDDCFVQALEGPLVAVEETFERIQCDERHADVVVLAAGAVAERAFASWSMAYAGRCTDQGARFNRLVDPTGQALAGAANGVMDLLGATVKRLMPAF